MKYDDTILPNQRILKKYFKDKNFYRSLFKLILDSSKYIEPNKKFKLIKHHKINYKIMGSNPVSLQFLSFLIKLIKPKTILEIGTFIGISAMEFSSASPKGTKIYTYEKFKEFSDIAKKNFKANKLNNIEIIEGDANEKIIQNNKKFDFIFLDGNKENYLNLFKLTINKLSKKGIYVVDNVFNQGDSLNKYPQTAKGRGVKKLLNYIKIQKNINCSVIPVYDGIILIQKN